MSQSQGPGWGQQPPQQWNQQPQGWGSGQPQMNGQPQWGAPPPQKPKSNTALVLGLLTVILSVMCVVSMAAHRSEQDRRAELDGEKDRQNAAASAALAGASSYAVAAAASASAEAARMSDPIYARCGRAPSRSAWDHELIGSEAYLRQTAHDPGSIDVENCTEPVAPDAETCWVSLCQVRGTNALGARVLNRVRLTYARGQFTSAEHL